MTLNWSKIVTICKGPVRYRQDSSSPIAAGVLWDGDSVNQTPRTACTLRKIQKKHYWKEFTQLLWFFKDKEKTIRTFSMKCDFFFTSNAVVWYRVNPAFSRAVACVTSSCPVHGVLSTDEYHILDRCIDGSVKSLAPHKPHLWMSMIFLKHYKTTECTLRNGQTLYLWDVPIDKEISAQQPPRSVLAKRFRKYLK